VINELEMSVIVIVGVYPDYEVSEIHLCVKANYVPIKVACVNFEWVDINNSNISGH
jgi:hypothetical protein